MFTLWQDYEIKDENIKQELENIIKNPIPHIQKRYKASFLDVLIRFKKVFGVTPVALKANTTEQAQKLREFALYILVTYANDYETIQNEFNISKEELENIKNNATLAVKYEKEITKFFSYSIESELSNIYQNLCFKDSILNNYEGIQKALEDGEAKSDD